MTFQKWRYSSTTDKIFDIIVFAVLSVLLIVVLYPLYFVVIASFSDANAVNRGEVLLWVKGFNLDAYTTVFKDSRILTGYGNTIFYTIGGTLLSVFITVCAAFPLSRKNLAFHGFWTWFFLITMYFGGGLIPTYLQVQRLHLTNTVWAVMIVGCLSVYNLIICRTFFTTNIPDELWEAASIDGCTMYKFFYRIVIPNAKAIIAIMVLYYAVAMWNDYMRALIYLNDVSQYPLQMVLRDLLLSTQGMEQNLDPALLDKAAQRGQALKYAAIIFSSVPVLAIYPFVQKHFVKGVMIGAVKG
ncbi:MAG: carbohydrate ABC transporter permease [Oscillospiraceae bacterium]|nr:carbohydrate ABC transporter permease [Oscillospiraceae bacterium]